MAAPQEGPRPTFKIAKILDQPEADSILHPNKARRNALIADFGDGEIIINTSELTSEEILPEKPIALIRQDEGISAIRRVSQGSLAFSDLYPIKITDIRLNKPHSRFPRPVIYMGTSSGGSISLEMDIYKEYIKSRSLAFVPHEDQRFGYQGFSFYPIKESKIDFDHELQSLRFRNGKFETQGWHGFIQQPFMDYLAGDLSIEDPNELPEFSIRKGKNIYLGRIGNETIQVTLGAPIKGLNSNDVIIKPKYDQKTGYLWVEGYDPVDKNRENILFSRRIIRTDINGHLHTEIVEWKGPGIESIKEWSYGNFPISKVQNAVIPPNTESKGWMISIDGQSMSISLNNSNIDRKKSVILIAKEDDDYKWIEVCQKDENGINKVKYLVRVIVEDGEVGFKGGWHGIERQLFIDYIDGKVHKEQLRSIKVKLDGNRIARICNYQGKELRIALRSNAFQEGEVVTLTSVQDENGQYNWFIFKEGKSTPSAKSIFIKDSLSFVTTTLEETTNKPVGYWTPNMIRTAALSFYEDFGDLTHTLLNENNTVLRSAINGKYPGGIRVLRKDLGIGIQLNNSGLYTDEVGNEWGTTSAIANIVGLNYSVLVNVLKKLGVGTIESRGKNGKKIPLYNIFQVKEALVRLGYTSGAQKMEVNTSENTAIDEIMVAMLAELEGEDKNYE